MPQTNNCNEFASRSKFAELAFGVELSPLLQKGLSAHFYPYYYHTVTEHQAHMHIPI